MCSDAPQATLLVDLFGEGLEGAKGSDDEIKFPPQIETRHVSVDDVQSCHHCCGPALQFPAQLGQHSFRQIQAPGLVPLLGHRNSYPACAASKFQHRPAEVLRLCAVKGDIVLGYLAGIEIVQVSRWAIEIGHVLNPARASRKSASRCNRPSSKCSKRLSA